MLFYKSSTAAVTAALCAYATFCSRIVSGNDADVSPIVTIDHRMETCANTPIWSNVLHNRISFYETPMALNSLDGNGSNGSCFMVSQRDGIVGYFPNAEFIGEVRTSSLSAPQVRRPCSHCSAIFPRHRTRAPTRLARRMKRAERLTPTTVRKAALLSTFETARTRPVSCRRRSR